MPTYEIEQYELHAQTYCVEAGSAAEAIVKLFDGEAEPVKDRFEFIETDDDRGLPADEYHELAEEPRRRGMTVGDVIPSIRDVAEVEPDSRHRM